MAGKIAPAWKVICMHGGYGLRFEQARPVQLTAPQQHPGKAVIVVRGRYETASAGAQLQTSPPTAARATIVERQVAIGAQLPRVGHPPYLVAGQLEKRVGHPEWTEDALSEEAVQIKAAQPFDHHAQNVGRDRVIPALTGRKFQRQLGQCRDELVGTALLLKLVEPQSTIFGVDHRLPLEAVGQPRRMAEQVDHSHRLL